MSLAHELKRKAFHMLSLAYWGAYELLGYPRVMPPMYAWSALVAAVEVSRLYAPGLNRSLLRLFGNIARGDEQRRVSGLFHTTVGVLLLWVAFGADRRLCGAGVFCVAFGDAAAALVGKTLGRIRLGGSKKSLEGSLACWLACFISCSLWGFGWASCAAAAATSTLIEYCPTTAWFNDNLWMPVAAAATLRALS